jgi:hypothetical protein
VKKLLLLVIFIVVLGSTAFAEGAARGGQFGIQTAVILSATGISPGPGAALGAKYMISDNMALRAALGIVNISSGGGSTTAYDLGVGFEYHFGGKGGVSPYVGAQVGYSGGSFSGGGTAPTDFGLNGVFGAEYFFSSNFSAAGELSLGFNSGTAGGVTTTVIGTGSALFLLTWYIN